MLNILHIFYLPAKNSYRIPKNMKYIEITIPGDCLQIDNDIETRKKYLMCGYLEVEKYLKNLSNK